MTEKTLVFLPGTLCDARLYSVQIAHFTACGWRVRTPVVLGHPSGLRGLAAQFLANLPERFALVGLSLGGSIALAMVEQEPDRVSHLALIGCTDDVFTSAALAAKEADHAAARTMGLETYCTDVMLSRYLHPDNLGRDDLRQVVIDMALDHGLDVWQGQNSLLANRPSYRTTLQAYSSPTLIACGMADKIVPPAVHHDMARAIGGQCVEFSNCGHLPPLEDPAAVTAALASLLA